MVIAEQMWHSENAALGFLFIRQCSTMVHASSRGMNRSSRHCYPQHWSEYIMCIYGLSPCIKQRNVHGHFGSALESSQDAVWQLPFLSLDAFLKGKKKLPVSITLSSGVHFHKSVTRWPNVQFPPQTIGKYEEIQTAKQVITFIPNLPEILPVGQLLHTNWA